MNLRVLNHSVPPYGVNPVRANGAVLNVGSKLCECHFLVLLSYAISIPYRSASVKNKIRKNQKIIEIVVSPYVV
jgi:hypothetical protein